MGNLTHIGEYLPRAAEAPLPAVQSLTDGMPTSVAKSDRGLPSKRAGDTFESFDLKRNPDMFEAYEQCQKVALREAWCAFLCGDPGNGKTHLAIAAMNAYGVAARFWKVPDYLDWLRYMRYDREIDEFTLTRSYRNDDFLLVFDDLGVEKATEWAGEQLYKVLDSRYDNELPTIITSNQKFDRIDDRLKSRYASGLVVCRGKDLRRAEAQQRRLNT